MPDYYYSIALSFAGQDRILAERLATALSRSGVKVFYDRFEQHELWGKNLHERLREIYTKESRFCVIFITDAYLNGMWTNFERQQIIERLAQEKGNDYILPIRLNGCDREVPGLSRDVAYIAASDKDHQGLLKIIKEKT
jgi:hypothetical protein